MSNLGHCRDCGATVIWSKTTSGANVPLNPLPINVAVSILHEDGAPVAIRPAHSVHIDTCTKKRASRRTRA